MIAKKVGTLEYIKEVPQWEKDYLDMQKDNLSKQQIELLNGRSIKSDEGMIYGAMYADWKRRKWNV
tara:strand:- start:166 stop:363 length:198 start_codon:yes stop_codon:yes gene_type:complete